MGAIAKIAAKLGWKVVKKYYGRIMRWIGEGWTVNQIINYIKKHM
ncbi:aureocin A53 family class IId bacteriocin [Terrilactibacillus sp. S3-3]|nr:aureocin A53 family class IId bacteriocin [Terrilactibacillus sp. S3-3]